MADILGRQSERSADFRWKPIPCGCHFVFSDLERLILGESVPALGVAAKCAIARAAYTLDNVAHAGLKNGKFRPAPGKMLNHPDCLRAREDPHHSTTLFRGYSTIPRACASLRRGITSHAADSSITVLTANQSASLR